jgi:hypothetical protein
MPPRTRVPASAVGALITVASVAASAIPAASLTPEEQAFVDNINAARAERGLPALTVDEGLTMLAEQHSASMAGAGALSHTPSLGSVVARVHPEWTRIGENVGSGSSVAQINAALLGSAQHAANIYGPYNLIGVGVVTSPAGVMYVTETFVQGVPAPAPAVPAVASSEAVAPDPAPIPTVKTSIQLPAGIRAQLNAARAASLRQAAASSAAPAAAVPAQVQGEHEARVIVVAPENTRGVQAMFQAAKARLGR